MTCTVSGWALNSAQSNPANLLQTVDFTDLSFMLKVKGLDIYIPPLTGKPRPAAVYN